MSSPVTLIATCIPAFALILPVTVTDAVPSIVILPLPETVAVPLAPTFAVAELTLTSSSATLIPPVGCAVSASAIAVYSDFTVSVCALIVPDVLIISATNSASAFASVVMIPTPRSFTLAVSVTTAALARARPTLLTVMLPSTSNSAPSVTA